MIRQRRYLALLGGIGLLFAATMTVAAYGPQVPSTITVSPPSETLRCDRSYPVRATVLDQDGAPIKRLTVTWSFTSSPSSEDEIKVTSSKTNGQGVATAIVKLACVPGDRTITATTDGISGSAVVHVDLAHGGAGNRAGGVLLAAGGVEGVGADSDSNISTTPSDGHEAPMILVMIAVVAAVAISLRVLALRRR
jgi:Big-like domain-containing protein